MKKFFSLPILLCLAGVLFYSFSLQVNATTLDEESLSQLEDVDEPGSYAIIMTYEKEGRKLEKTVYVTISGAHTIIGENGIAIDGNSFQVEVVDVRSFTQEEWIQASGAKAWDTSDGSLVNISGVDTTGIEEKIGNYQIIFETRGNISTAVPVEVVENRNKAEIDYQKNKNEKLDGQNQSNLQMTWGEFSWTKKIGISLFLFLIILIPLIVLVVQHRYTTNLVRQVSDTLKKQK